MTFAEFKSKFDYPGSVVLLEGKRDVLDENKTNLVNLGLKLASETDHILFRSGNASGSDELFSQGVSEINPKRLEIIMPYTTHRSKKRYGEMHHSLNDINLVEEDEIIRQSKTNKSYLKFVDSYVAGDINRMSIKAAYIIRDTIKVLGTKSGIAPCTFGIFYDDLKKPKSGGTGHTMNVCEDNNIDIIDQRVWLSWL